MSMTWPRVQAQVITPKLWPQKHPIRMVVKGWTVAGSKPPDDITRDGETIFFAGHGWYSEMDVFRLNTPPLYFGKKKRGRLPDSVRMYNGRMGKSVAEFSHL